jgi:hypothetical protein
MGLKYRITKLEEVPETVRNLYTPEGDAFVLQVEGAVPKDKLDEFRSTNIQLSQQLEKFKNIDPAKYNELVDLQRQLNEGELLKAGKIDEVVNGRVAAMRAELENQRDTFKTRAEKSESQLALLMIDSAARTEAVKLGVEPTALDDVVLRARGVYRMVEGSAVPQDAEGKVIYGKDGTTPMAMTDWITGLKKSAPHLFAGSRGGGAGGGGRAATGSTANLSPAQKIALGLSQGVQREPAGGS